MSPDWFRYDLRRMKGPGQGCEQPYADRLTKKAIAWPGGDLKIV
jgi:hypothetical protein